jgi:hypothetical protein
VIDNLKDGSWMCFPCGGEPYSVNVETEQHDQESNFYVPTLEELMDKLEE